MMHLSPTGLERFTLAQTLGPAPTANLLRIKPATRVPLCRKYLLR